MNNNPNDSFRFDSAQILACTSSVFTSHFFFTAMERMKALFGDGYELIVSLAGGFVLVAFSTTTEVTSVYLARWVSPKISVTCIVQWNKNSQDGR